MRKLTAFAALAAVCLAPALAVAEAPVDETAAIKGQPLFESDFSSPAMLVESWTGTKGVSIVDGKLRVPDGTNPWWNGREPLDVVVEMRFTVQPAWARKPKSTQWTGFYCNRAFYCVRAQDSNLFYLGGGVVDYRALPDVKLGKPLTLTLFRRKVEDRAKYSLYVNGRHINDSLDKIPYVNWQKNTNAVHAITFCAGGFDIEVEHLGIYLPKTQVTSRNMIVNSGFEFDHEGIPPYYSFSEWFDWNRPPDEYETRYLKTFSVDRNEKHSGKQSLRIAVNNSSLFLGFDPVAAGGPMTIRGRAGVFSAWMKSSVDGIRVHLHYGNGLTRGSGRREFVIGREWKRYEVTAVDLPATGFFDHPLRLSVIEPKKHDAVLWVDDLQAEIVEMPSDKEDRARAERRKKAQEEAAAAGDFDLATSEDAGTDKLELEDREEARTTKGGFDLNKSYATPYMPCDTDAAHYGPERFAPSPLPRGETPVKTADEAALRGFEREKDKPIVLGRLDYYMNEKVAPFRVWDANGKLEETSVDISNLPYGTNTVSIQAHGRAWPATVVKLPYKKGATQRNFFNRSVVNEGESILMGAMTLKARFYPPAADGRVPIIDWLWKKGFRSIHLAVWGIEEYVRPGRAIMKQCAEIGMRVMLWTGIDGEAAEEVPSDPILAARAREKAKRDGTDKKVVYTAQQIRDEVEMPYIVAHNVLDEPDSWMPSDVARDAMLKFKRGYPYVPCMMNNIGFGRGYRYADAVSDVFMLDSYLSNGEWRTVDSVVQFVDYMRLTAIGKPCWYLVVGNNAHHYREPTFGEQVAQSWGGICAGATGLSWYIGMPAVEPCWKAIERTNREMLELKDVILSEEIAGEAGVDVSIRHLRSMTRRLKGEWYVFSAYLEWTPLEKATFTMPPDAPQNGTIEVLYENRTLPLKDGHFSDSYKPFERHLYRIKK